MGNTPNLTGGNCVAVTCEAYGTHRATTSRTRGTPHTFWTLLPSHPREFARNVEEPFRNLIQSDSDLDVHVPFIFIRVTLHLSPPVRKNEQKRNKYMEHNFDECVLNIL